MLRSATGPVSLSEVLRPADSTLQSRLLLAQTAPHRLRPLFLSWVAPSAGLDVSGQWLHVAPNLPAAVACTLPLLAACYWSVANADRNTGFAEMRQLFKETMIPQLRVLPLWVSLCVCCVWLGGMQHAQCGLAPWQMARRCTGLADGYGLLPLHLPSHRCRCRG